jgi:hypothetical protein
MKIFQALRPKKEYFDSPRYDRVAEILCVKLRDHRRYEFRRVHAMKASYRYLPHMIIFEKDWLCNKMGAMARCAVLSHELWHSKSAIRHAVSILFVASFMIPFGWPLVAGLASYWTSTTLRAPYMLVPIFLITTVGLESYGERLLFQKLIWPVEYGADEAAVRFVGVNATIEELHTLPNRTPRFWSTHPPLEARLKRAKRLEVEYPSPIIDFATLERDYPQEFLHPLLQ